MVQKVQCYALQQYLENIGNEVVVINYRPKYKKYRYEKYGNPFINAYKEFQINGMKQAAKKFARTILNYRTGSEHLRQWNGFEDFSEKYLNLTHEYASIDELRKNPPACDLYISGSDQLWNPKLTNGQLDEAYFLNFGDKDVRRITYAISACELDLDRYRVQLVQLCSELEAISLREPEGKESLERLLEKKLAYARTLRFWLIPMYSKKSLQTERLMITMIIL